MTELNVVRNTIVHIEKQNWANWAQNSDIKCLIWKSSQFRLRYAHCLREATKAYIFSGWTTKRGVGFFKARKKIPKKRMSKLEGGV